MLWNYVTIQELTFCVNIMTLNQTNFCILVVFRCMLSVFQSNGTLFGLLLTRFLDIICLFSFVFANKNMFLGFGKLHLIKYYWLLGYSVYLVKCVEGSLVYWVLPFSWNSVHYVNFWYWYLFCVNILI